MLVFVTMLTVVFAAPSAITQRTFGTLVTREMLPVAKRALDKVAIVEEAGTGVVN